MYKAVIFDFFDVIYRDHQKAWLKRHGFERSGLFAEASEQLDLGLIDYEEYVNKLASASGQTAGEIKQQFKEFASPDEHTVQIIRELRDKNIKTCLISNSNTGEIRPILQSNGLEQMFDEIIISGEVKLAKPDPNVFNLMLKKLGALAEECIFTDDNIRNIEAALSVNMQAIHFLNANYLREKLAMLGLLARTETA